MTGGGLREVANPSELFLSERDLGSPGTAVFAGIEGTRPLLVEIQALVAPTSLGTPRRAVVGWDQSRLSMVLAVLEAHCGVRLSGHDVYLNVAGGLAHPGAGRRSRRRRGARVVARQRAAAGRRGLFRRDLAVGRGAAGGAGRGAAQGGAEARLCPRHPSGSRARRKGRASPGCRCNPSAAWRAWSPTSPRDGQRTPDASRRERPTPEHLTTDGRRSGRQGAQGGCLDEAAFPVAASSISRSVAPVRCLEMIGRIGTVDRPERRRQTRHSAVRHSGSVTPINKTGDGPPRSGYTAAELPSAAWPGVRRAGGPITAGILISWGDSSTGACRHRRDARRLVLSRLANSAGSRPGSVERIRTQPCPSLFSTSS